jgi:predicted DsbA family dithiol-disulfide isomerase
MQIDIIFDTTCPWCYIGKRRLEQALKGFPTVDVKPTWRPFLLYPEMPDSGISRETYLVRKFGSEARVRRIYGAICDAGQSVEIDFEFDRIGHTPNTVDSHRLVRYSARFDQAGNAVEALFYNYFVNGKNIGDRDVLLAVGRDLGLDPDALAAYLESDEDIALIHDENARAHRLGINGVPSFLVNERHVISGAQESQVLARVLDVALAEAAA